MTVGQWHCCIDSIDSCVNRYTHVYWHGDGHAAAIGYGFFFFFNNFAFLSIHPRLVSRHARAFSIARHSVVLPLLLHITWIAYTKASKVTTTTTTIVIAVIAIGRIYRLTIIISYARVYIHAISRRYCIICRDIKRDALKRLLYIYIGI